MIFFVRVASLQVGSHWALEVFWSLVAILAFRHCGGSRGASISMYV